MTGSPYSAWPDRAYLRELRRPWKVLSFSIGMTWLLYGALFYEIRDWDIGVSIVMGCLTYLLAPWSVRLIAKAIRLRSRWWLLHIAIAVIAALLVADTSYMTYHAIAGNPTDREGNFRASITLYFLAGILWAYQGPLRQLVHDIRRAFE